MKVTITAKHIRRDHRKSGLYPMRLSEAMLLGSTQVRLRSESFRGCAVSCIAVANGAAVVGEDGYADETQVAEWFRQSLQPEIELDVALPCKCLEHRLLGDAREPKPLWYALIEMWDEHVFGDRTWSIEALAEWLEGVQPRERISDNLHSPGELGAESAGREKTRALSK